MHKHQIIVNNLKLSHLINTYIIIEFIFIVLSFFRYSKLRVCNIYHLLVLFEQYAIWQFRNEVCFKKKLTSYWHIISKNKLLFFTSRNITILYLLILLQVIFTIWKILLDLRLFWYLDKNSKKNIFCSVTLCGILTSTKLIFCL